MSTDSEKTRLLEKAKEFLRSYMQDSEQLNRLIRKEECTDSDRELAIMLSIDSYNTTTPISALTLDTFPSLKFLLEGAVIQLLTMKGILQSRNRLNYSSGGLSVQVSDKAGEYQAWISNLYNQLSMAIVNYKKQLNLESCYGGISSEYANLRWYW